ncbi:MAG: hypothetical protein GXO03_00215 [Aquificae bacterium]|nr:hypothetical protein [Aquificota bacterium]
MTDEKQEFSVVPFALVGFFATDEKDVAEALRTEITPEELEELQRLLAKYLFKEGVRVAVYPAVVPPEHAKEALKELERMIFGEEEGRD